jgi:tetratricopeptide (TPR) repeat protein
VQSKVPTTAAEWAAAHAELATENEALATQLAQETKDKKALATQLAAETKDTEALATQLTQETKDKEALAAQLAATTKQLAAETKGKEALARQQAIDALAMAVTHEAVEVALLFVLVQRLALQGLAQPPQGGQVGEALLQRACRRKRSDASAKIQALVRAKAARRYMSALWVGQQACDRGDLDSARNHFRMAFELSGSAWPAILATNMLLLHGEPDAAIVEYERLLETALGHPNFLDEADKAAVQRRLQETRALVASMATSELTMPMPGFRPTSGDGRGRGKGGNDPLKHLYDFANLCLAS